MVLKSTVEIEFNPQSTVEEVELLRQDIQAALQQTIWHVRWKGGTYTSASISHEIRSGRKEVS
jgi:hypothetical protein